MDNGSNQNASDQQSSAEDVANQDSAATETGDTSQGESSTETTGEEGADAPADTTTPVSEEANGEPTPPESEQVVEEEEVPPVPTPEPVAPPPPAEEPAVVMADPAPAIQEAPVAESNATDEDPQVASLKNQLADFKVAVMRRGSEPSDFAGAAKLIAQITRFVIQSPKTPVLNALLAFFEENLKGACLNKNYMKGSTTLSMAEEQQVGYLYGLFSDMAQKKIVRINTGQVIQVLKKPEIVNFYERKMSVLKQAASAAALAE